MSVVSRNGPENYDSVGWPAEPCYALDGVRYIPTPQDWAEYQAWRDSLPAGPEPEPEDLGGAGGPVLPG
jgi:hypothetical protein